MPFGSRGTLLILAVLVILGGVGMGALIRLFAPPHAAPLRPAVVALSPGVGEESRPPTPNPTPTLRTLATVTQAPARTSLPTIAPTSTPTMAPTIAPTSKPTNIPTSTQTVEPPADRIAASHAVAQTWRIDEANVEVGTIVWVGSAVLHRDSIVFDVHKERIAGRPAGPCERETILHIQISSAQPSQTVPYQEINCRGESMSGVVRVYADGSGAFTGSFWTGNTKLGDFDARKGA